MPTDGLKLEIHEFNRRQKHSEFVNFYLILTEGVVVGICKYSS